MKTIEKQDSHHMRPGRENAVTAVTGVERGPGGALKTRFWRQTASLRDGQTGRKLIGDKEKEGNAEWHWLGRNGLGGDMTDAGSENRRRKPKCVEVNGRREERGEAGASG